MKNITCVLLYFVLWHVLHIVIIFLPFFGTMIQLTDQLSLFFLSSIPFAILSIFFTPLKPRHFVYSILSGSVIIIILYLFAGHTGNQAWKIVYIKYSFYSVAGSLAVSTFFYLIIMTGIFLRKSYDILSVRRTTTDESEQDELFYLKQMKQPEENLTFYKYKQLLYSSIGFAATKQNIILASIQLFINSNVFYFYDLVINPGAIKKASINESQKLYIEMFLLNSILQRPEVQINKPDSIVYINQAGDEEWQDFFSVLEFEALQLADEKSQPLLEGMQKHRELKIDDWSAFASIYGFQYKKLSYQNMPGPSAEE